jgi:hypothetical protein
LTKERNVRNFEVVPRRPRLGRPKLAHEIDDANRRKVGGTAGKERQAEHERDRERREVNGSWRLATRMRRRA